MSNEDQDQHGSKANEEKETSARATHTHALPSILWIDRHSPWPVAADWSDTRRYPQSYVRTR
jgi:hypothetical protein